MNILKGEEERTHFKTLQNKGEDNEVRNDEGVREGGMIRNYIESTPKLSSTHSQ